MWLACLPLYALSTLTLYLASQDSLLFASLEMLFKAIEYTQQGVVTLLPLAIMCMSDQTLGLLGLLGTFVNMA